MKKIKISVLGLLGACMMNAQTPKAPVGLRCDLIAHTDRVYVNGEVTQIPLSKIMNLVEPVQFVQIANKRPSFSWMMEDERYAIMQTAFQIKVGTSRESMGDIWDTGKCAGSNAMITFAGKELQPQTIYYWCVKQWNNKGEETPWSAVQTFITAKVLKPYASESYPLFQTDESYVSDKEIHPNLHFYDFGKDAFGRIKLTAETAETMDTLTVRFGEVITTQGRLDANPGGSRRYREVKLPLMQGKHTYKIAIEKDARNTREVAMSMPSYIGDVCPFRYCEIEGEVKPERVTREVVTYYFDDTHSSFKSDNSVLNDIWDFCKYSIKATSFTGYFVDGDRERIPYEADAYINQLCHYGVDSEYTLARKTQERTLLHPTWPTEWILSSVLLAWNDYLYTGNADFIKAYYTDLQQKALLPLTDKNGLISSRTGKLTDKIKKSVHYTNKEIMRDIVDWPHKGGCGVSNNDSGETDGFDFTDYNTVVNAYHNKALQVMSFMAKAIGKQADSDFYAKRAKTHKKVFNQLFFDKKKGYYNDGVDTEHSSLHANMFALTFGLVPQKYVKSVTDFVKTRGMACSVYGSQHLLDAVYEGENGAYGKALLTSRKDRGWAHAIYDVGTTISLEAWDNKYKPNQDWNHAWGAAPANIIPMRLMGIQPLTPGFGKMRIKLQPADLKWADLVYPTIKGQVCVSFVNKNKFEMNVVIPANTEAEVWVPNSSERKQELYVNGEKVKTKRVRGFYIIDELGSGAYKLSFTK